MAIVVAIFIFLVYLRTLAPTIVAGDAGELVTAAYELGVAHPPGYPLWCLLTNMTMTLLGNDLDIAYRANVFSALCGALTCALVFILARKLNVGRMAAFAGATLLGLSRELWAQSVIAEVYALNAVIFVGCLLCLAYWDKSRRHRWLMVFSLLLGLGMTNHHTIGILGPAALLYVISKQWRIFLNWRVVIGVVACFIMPLTIYFYLPLQAAGNPYMDWGHPETWSQVWQHINRSQYKANYLPLPHSVKTLFYQLTVVMRYLLEQFSPTVGVCILFAIPILISRKVGRNWYSLLALCLGMLIAFVWVLNFKFTRQDIEANKVFFIPVYVCVALLFMPVLDVIYNKLKAAMARRLYPIASVLAASICLMIPAGLSFGYNFSANDLSQYWYAEDHARNILETMEDSAVIFPSGDHNTFPLIYLHRLERLRPDIVIADKYGYVESRDFPEVASNSHDLRVPRAAVIHHLLANTDRPVYFTVKSQLPNIEGVRQVQMGFLYRASRQPPQISPDSLWQRYRYRNMAEGFDTPPDYGAVNIVSDFFFFRALSHLRSNQQSKALAAFAKAGSLADGIKEVFNNIGSALAEHGLIAEATAYYQRALRLDDQYISALWNSARTCSASGNYQEASHHFQKLQKHSPDDFRVPGELGFLNLRHLNQTKTAVEYFDQSLALNPDQPQIEGALRELAQTGAPDLFPDTVTADVMEHDFGEVILGIKAQTSISLTNVSGKKLKITDVRADCGCVSPTVRDTLLKAGQSTTLDIHYHESRRMGAQERTVTVTNSTGPPTVITIRADVVGKYRVEPDHLVIDEALPNISQTLALHISARDGKPFKIAQLSSALDELLLESDRKDELALKHKISVLVTPTEKIGSRTGNMTVEVADGDQTVVTIPITLQVREPIRLTPRSIFLSSLKRSGEKIVEVTIDLPQGWTVNVTQINESADWIRLVDQSEALTDGTVLKLALDTERMPDTFNGSIAIATDHISIPHFAIPVYGFIR